MVQGVDRGEVLWGYEFGPREKSRSTPDFGGVTAPLMVFGGDAGADRAPPRSEALRDRIPRLLIKLLAIYTSIVVPIVAAVVLVGSHDPRARAIILMALGLVLCWVLIGGLATLRYRDRLRAWLLPVRLGWGWKFLLLATALALVEEAITTTMTNLAPEFGSQIGAAYITASNNYLVVVAFSSVVVFVPEFVGWVLLLRRYAFSANEVFLLYGLLGTTMEATLNPTALIAGFWFFVYGLMLYLPAYTVPARPDARRPRWFHYILAYFVPLLFALPVVGADVLLAHRLGIHLWP
jgi:hypothetical protein